MNEPLVKYDRWDICGKLLHKKYLLIKSMKSIQWQISRFMVNVAWMLILLKRVKYRTKFSKVI